MRKMALIGAMAVVCLAAPAMADTGALRDPKTDMKFDIIRIAQDHGRERQDERAWIKHTVEFRKGFSAEAFDKDGALQIYFTSHDRSIKVLNRDGEWKARMSTNGDKVNRPKVWRPDGRTIRLSFPPKWIERGVDRYRWRASSAYYGSKCDAPPGEPCTLEAPGDMTGNLSHVL